MPQILPNFLGIGAGRAGTTWLRACLSEHPEVYVVPNEVYFFTTRRIVHVNATSHFEKGLSWYSSLFEGHTDGVKRWGEISPSYLYDEEIPRRIYEAMPDVKLICSLRDQSERAYSAYRLFLDLNPDLIPTSFSFMRYLTFHAETYGREGFYLEHIRRYLEYFPRESILILIYDDLQSDPIGYLRQVYEFLEIDISFIPYAANRKINSRNSYEFPKRDLLKAIEVACRSRNLVRLANLIHRHNMIRGTADHLPERHKMTPTIRSMFANLFSEHNKALGEFLDRDLGHWNIRRL